MTESGNLVLHKESGGHWDKHVDLRCEDKPCFQRQFCGELKLQKAIYQHIVYYRLWAKTFKSWMNLFLASNLGQGQGANKMKTVISLQHNDKLHIIHCLWCVSWLQRPAILQWRRQLHKYLHFSAILWKGLLFFMLMEKKGQDYSRTWVLLDKCNKWTALKNIKELVFSTIRDCNRLSFGPPAHRASH